VENSVTPKRPFSGPLNQAHFKNHHQYRPQHHQSPLPYGLSPASPARNRRAATKKTPATNTALLGASKLALFSDILTLIVEHLLQHNVGVAVNTDINYLFRMVQALHAFRLQSNILMSVTTVID
jgi:hypothetical protein